MISINKALYLSAFSIFFSFVKGQNKVPFGVVKAEEGYANVRVHKDNYRKIVDKIRMRKGDVFVYVNLLREKRNGSGSNILKSRTKTNRLYDMKPLTRKGW
jgi:hypothetical protein